MAAVCMADPVSFLCIIGIDAVAGLDAGEDFLLSERTQSQAIHKPQTIISSPPQVVLQLK